jgi:hypothetical protein
MEGLWFNNEVIPVLKEQTSKRYAKLSRPKKTLHVASDFRVDEMHFISRKHNPH